MTKAMAEKFEIWASIGRFASEHSLDETKEKYPSLSKATLYDYSYTYQATGRLRKFIPDGEEPIDFLRRIGVCRDIVRIIVTFTDDAMQDAIDALSHGGKVTRTSGIVWTDGRTRPLKDCRKTDRKRSAGVSSERVKTPGEELAELIANAVTAFNASVECYLADYQDAPKEAASREMEKAQQNIENWIKEMQ